MKQRETHRCVPDQGQHGHDFFRQHIAKCFQRVISLTVHLWEKVRTVQDGRSQRKNKDGELATQMWVAIPPCSRSGWLLFKGKDGFCSKPEALETATYFQWRGRVAASVLRILIGRTGVFDGSHSKLPWPQADGKRKVQPCGIGHYCPSTLVPLQPKPVPRRLWDPGRCLHQHVYHTTKH